MIKYVIGIDIDGCLNDQRIGMHKILKRDYNIDLDLDNFYEIFDSEFTGKKALDFFGKYNKYILDITDIEKDCDKAIDTLNENGIKTEIITARPYRAASITTSWLNKHKINYSNILFECGKKVEACLWREVNIMIEDTPKNIEHLEKAGIPVIVFDRPYNRNIDCSNIVLRSNDWNEICNFILNDYKRLQNC